MKKLILLVYIFLTAVSQINNAQNHTGNNRRPPLEKIAQLERAKLIELLDLNEDVAVRFFVRRKEFREQQRSLFDERDNMIKGIEKKLKDDVSQTDKEYKDQVHSILTIDERIVDHKEEFYNSLNDILSPKQILKLAVFDDQFMKEIRELLMKRRNKR